MVTADVGGRRARWFTGAATLRIAAMARLARNLCPFSPPRTRFAADTGARHAHGAAPHQDAEEGLPTEQADGAGHDQQGELRAAVMLARSPLLACSPHDMSHSQAKHHVEIFDVSESEEKPEVPKRPMQL